MRRSLFRPSDRRPIYLVSTAGYPNFGDEYIARAWLRYLARRFPDRPVWLDCFHPGRAAVLFRDDHPNLRVTDTLWQLSWKAPFSSPEEQHRVVADRIRNLGTPELDAGLVLLRGMPQVHLLGGGFVNGIWLQNFAHIAALATLQQHFGTRVMTSGLGLLPLKDRFTEYYRPLLRGFDFADVRDTASAKAYGLPLGADDAFLGLAERGTSPMLDAPDVMVLVQGDFLDRDQAEAVGRTIDGFLAAHAASDGGSVGFAEGIPLSDARFLERTRERVGDRLRFYPFLEVWDRGIPARPGQVWLTTRFHFHLLAAASGAMGYVLNVRPGYYEHKHESLTALGSGWVPLPLDTREFPTLPEPTFPAQAALLSAGRLRAADRMYSSR